MRSTSITIRFLATMAVCIGILAGCQPTSTEPTEPIVETPHSRSIILETVGWVELFDGKVMGDWKVIRFTGNDEAAVEEGKIVLQAGYPMAGICYQTGDNNEEKPGIPNSNYELELQAMKIDGTDFFCCLTFPVNDDYCSLVVGGWGGTVTGISCIDGDDASTNQTKTVRKYEKDQWYTIRVRVTDEKLTCFLDDESIVDLELEGIKLSLRTEVDNCKPLSLCSFSTTAGFRNLRFRPIEKSRLKQAEGKDHE